MDVKNNGNLKKTIEIFSHRNQWFDLPEQVYVPSEYNWILNALKLMNVNGEDVLYDFGSGDGRVLAIAKTVFNVKKAKGIENNPDLVKISHQNFYRMKKEGLPTEGIEVIKRNYLDINVSDATAVYCYKDPFFDSKLDDIARKLDSELQRGARISIIETLPSLTGYKSFDMFHVEFMLMPLVTGIYLYRKV